MDILIGREKKKIMMAFKRRIKPKYIFKMLGFALSLIIFYSCNSDLENVAEVTLTAHYMAYACGEDCPQYKIKSVQWPSDKKVADSQIIDYDLEVKFLDEKVEQELMDLVGICAICYKYEFQGSLSFNKEASFYRVDVEKFNTSLYEDCCDR